MWTQIRQLLNSVIPDQTAPIGSGSTLFAKRLLKHFSRRQKQTTFVVNVALSYLALDDK